MRRLGGYFHNGNRQHISTDTIRTITEAAEKAPWDKLTKREYALLAMAVGSLLLALLPLLLHVAGTGWRPGIRSGGDSGQGDSGKSTRKAGSTLRHQPAATR